MFAEKAYGKNQGHGKTFMRSNRWKDCHGLPQKGGEEGREVIKALTTLKVARKVDQEHFFPHLITWEQGDVQWNQNV